MPSPRTFTVARPARFFPTADLKGKWHAAYRVDGVPVCGSGATLATDGAEWITSTPGTASADVHPIVCRRCLSSCTAPGYAAKGTL